MLINEILDSDVAYKVIEETDEIFGTAASIGGRRIEFYAEKYADGKWTLSFGEMKNRRLTTEITGSGAELEVFAMVKASIVEFAEKYNPKLMNFTASKTDNSDRHAEKNNRGDLYDRLIKRFKIPGYKYSRYQGDKTDSFALEKE